MQKDYPIVPTLLYNLLWTIAVAAPFWDAFVVMLFLSALLILLINFVWVSSFFSKLLFSLTGVGARYALRMVFHYLTFRRKRTSKENFDFEAVAEQCLRSSAWVLLVIPLAFCLLTMCGNLSVPWRVASACSLTGGLFGFLLARKGKIIPLPMDIG